MRRVLGVLVIAAFAPAMAHAAVTAGGSSSFDLGAQVMMRVFGETSDFAASRSASFGDRASETPLRDLAFELPSISTGSLPEFGSSDVAYVGFAEPTVSNTPSSSYAAVFGGRIVQPNDDHFVRSAVSLPPVAAVAQPDRAAAPLVDVAVAPAAPLSPPVGIAPPAFDQGTVASSVHPLSTHVGRMELLTSGATTAQPQLGESDDAYGAAANFDLRAGQHRVNVDVDSSYEHLMRDDTTAYSSAPLSANWQIAGNSAQSVPNYADVSKLAVGANLGIPVTHTMTLNLNYNAQRLLGAYGLPGLTNLNAIDNSYGGNLTFAIPRWSSELSVSALQYRYQDFVLPANTFSDTRANVNLTVKF